MKKLLSIAALLITTIASSNAQIPVIGGTIKGHVFQDENCDGIRQVDEPLIPGVAVDLLVLRDLGEGEVEIQVGWTSTGVDGEYAYEHLDPSQEYIIHFIPPQGVSLSPRNQGSDDDLDSDPFPHRQKTSPISVAHGEVLDNVDAGLCLSGNLEGFGNIMGFVFEDQNGNGLQEDHEPLVPGVEVELYLQNANGGQLLESYISDANGEYMFSNIPAGKVIFINFKAPLGYNFTTKDSGSDDSIDSDVIPVFGRTESIVLYAGQLIHDIDAGLVHTPTVPIEKDGEFDDWASVSPLGWDSRDMGHPDDIADWENLWVTHYDGMLSLSYTSYNELVFSSAYNIFLDTNFSSNTGFEIGNLRAEYLIQGDAVYHYQGTGRDWNWTRVGSVELAISGKRAEICLPLSLLKDPFNIKVLLFGDNSSIREGGEADYLPDSKQGLIYQVRENLQNQPPVGFDKSVQTLKGVPVIVPFSGNDPEGFEVTFSIASFPTHGWISWESNRVTYHPNEGFTGSDSFEYLVSDGLFDSSPATITVHVLDSDPVDCPGYLSENIFIDGSMDDWGSVPTIAYDAPDINIHPYEADWRQLWLANDAGFLYFGVKHDTTPFYEACTWANSYFIDSDDDTHTGFIGGAGEYPIGADLLLQGAFLFRYTGSGTDWSWDCIDAITHAGSGTCTEFRIDRWHIGFDNTQIKILLAGFNGAFIPNAETDYMPELDHGGICYRFQHPSNQNNNTVQNEAGETIVQRDYQLSFLGTKPTASLSGALVSDALMVDLKVEVADGQTWSFQRSSDLVNWETVREQVIRENSTFVLDPEAGDLPNASFYRAILINADNNE